LRASEVRELSDEDLVSELEGSYKELLNLRIRLATKQLPNTSQIRVVKKNVARIQTVMHERKVRIG